MKGLCIIALAVLGCLALLVTPSNALRCYKCNDSRESCTNAAKLLPAQSCINNIDGKCYKVIVEVGPGHKVYHRGCTDAAHPDAFCKTEAAQMALSGSLEYCGVCSGDECNAGALITPYRMLTVLLPWFIAYFFSK